MKIRIAELGEHNKIYTKHIMDFLLLFAFFCLNNLTIVATQFGVSQNYMAYSFYFRIGIYAIYILYLLITEHKISIMWLIFNLGYLSILVCSTAFHMEVLEYNTDLLIYYLYGIFPITLCLVKIDDVNFFLKMLRLVAYINLIRVIIIPFFPEGINNESGMGMAYASIVCWAVITDSVFKNKNIIDILIIIYSGVVLIVFGTRGVILCILGVLIYNVIKIENTRIRLLLFSFFIVFFSFLYLNFSEVLSNLSRLLTNMGLESKVLLKVMNHSLSYANGRDYIWNKMLDAIWDKPIIGYGIGYDRYIGGGAGNYAHNIFIELLVNYGVLVGTILTGVILCLCIIMLFSRKIDVAIQRLYAIFTIPGMCMLMVSGSMYSTYMLFASFSILILCFDRYNGKKIFFNVRK